MHIDTYTYNLL